MITKWAKQLDQTCANNILFTVYYHTVLLLCCFCNGTFQYISIKTICSLQQLPRGLSRSLLTFLKLPTNGVEQVPVFGNFRAMDYANDQVLCLHTSLWTGGINEDETSYIQACAIESVVSESDPCKQSWQDNIREI